MFIKYLDVIENSLKKKIFIFLCFFINLLILNNTVFFNYVKANEIQSEKLSLGLRKKSKDKYILGPGDTLLIMHKELPEYSGNFSIGPDGNILLPDIFQVYAEGYTVSELKKILSDEYKKYIKVPNIYISIINLRPVRVYLSGEVRRPGFYTISSYQDLTNYPYQDAIRNYEDISFSPSGKYSQLIAPTVFDSLRAAQGLTTYSDLSNIQVIRKNTISDGGGYIKTELNFLSLINGDESQNIRVYDGDRIIVKKTKNNPKDQFLKVLNTNISPQTIPVYVTGKVASPGQIMVPQGSGLNQAVALAGGKNFLSGDIRFLRFKDSDGVDKRSFRFSRNAKLSSHKNPILVAGDVIHVKGSILGNTTEFLNTMAAPMVTSYTLYNLFNEL